MDAELKKADLTRRLIGLRGSEAYLKGDKKLREEAQQIREELKALQYVGLNDVDRARAIIDARAAPSKEEVEGLAAWQQTI